MARRNPLGKITESAIDTAREAARHPRQAAGRAEKAVESLVGRAREGVALGRTIAGQVGGSVAGAVADRVNERLGRIAHEEQRPPAPSDRVTRDGSAGPATPVPAPVEEHRPEPEDTDAKTRNPARGAAEQTAAKKASAKKAAGKKAAGKKAAAKKTTAKKTAAKKTPAKKATAKKTAAKKATAKKTAAKKTATTKAAPAKKAPAPGTTPAEESLPNGPGDRLQPSRPAEQAPSPEPPVTGSDQAAAQEASPADLDTAPRRDGDESGS